MKRLMTALLISLMAAAAQPAWAEGQQAEIMQDATTILNDFVNIPENAIPPALLSQAYGIAIIPDVIKAGFVVGGRYGKGVLSVRAANGSWSHPVFIKLAGASLGWQIGAASSDIILVFKNRRGVDRIINGQVTLGADVSVAAGPVGRSASAATNLQMDAEIYSYSRSRGLFAGLALEGGVITIAKNDNSRYYGGAAGSRTILSRTGLDQLPQTARRLVYTLDRYMPGLRSGDGAGRGDNAATEGDTSGHAQPYRNNGQARSGTNDGQTEVRQYNDYGREQPYGGNQTGSPADGNGQSTGNRPPAGQSGAGNYGPVYDGASQQ